jgi:hypothetical protein
MLKGKNTIDLIANCLQRGFGSYDSFDGFAIK